MEQIVDYFHNTNFLDFDIDIEITKKLAIQSCSKNHMTVIDAKDRWEQNHTRLRSNKVFLKSLVYYYIKKNKYLHKSIDKIFNRSH